MSLAPRKVGDDVASITADPELSSRVGNSGTLWGRAPICISSLLDRCALAILIETTTFDFSIGDCAYKQARRGKQRVGRFGRPAVAAWDAHVAYGRAKSRSGAILQKMRCGAMLKWCV